MKERGKTSKIRALIIKVVGNFCNLRCRYCFYYLNDQQKFHVMNDSLVEKLVQEYSQYSPKHVHFIWHGGEPLLAGLSFFEKIVKIQERCKKKGQIIKNAIQTNATLIDEKWATFFKAYRFRVGVSLDGNKKNHDRFRMGIHGEGTFERVIRGIKILRAHGIEPGIIHVLTHSNLSHENEDFKFLTDDLRIRSWGINVFYDNNGYMSSENVNNEELVSYFKKLINLWLKEDNHRLKIRELDAFAAGVFRKEPNPCAFNGHCGDFLCLDYNGKVYPCDRFSSNSKFYLGDLSKQSMIDIVESDNLQKFRKFARRMPSACRQCQWWNACHNGCSAIRSNRSNLYYYCQARKKIFSYVERVLKIYTKGGD